MPHAPTSASFAVYSHGSRTGRVPVPKGSTAFHPTVHRPKENLLSWVVVMAGSFRTSMFRWSGLWSCVASLVEPCVVVRCGSRLLSCGRGIGPTVRPLRVVFASSQFICCGVKLNTCARSRQGHSKSPFDGRVRCGVQRPARWRIATRTCATTSSRRRRSDQRMRMMRHPASWRRRARRCSASIVSCTS